ncbi:MAG: hypothetical protein QXV22_05390, partial [Thermoplasmataceae archaeon]
KLNTKYFTQAFLYLIAGTVLMMVRGLGVVSISFDSISLVWFFGFVLSMVFGITNIMVPSYSGSTEFSLPVVETEILLLDIAVPLLFISLNVPILRFLFIPAMVVLFGSMIIHIYDIVDAETRSHGKDITARSVDRNARQ